MTGLKDLSLLRIAKDWRIWACSGLLRIEGFEPAEDGAATAPRFAALQLALHRRAMHIYTMCGNLSLKCGDKAVQWTAFIIRRAIVKINSCLVAGGGAGEVADEVVKEHLPHQAGHDDPWSHWWYKADLKGYADHVEGAEEQADGGHQELHSLLLKGKFIILHQKITVRFSAPWSHLESLFWAPAELSSPPGRSAAHWRSTWRKRENSSLSSFLKM